MFFVENSVLHLLGKTHEWDKLENISESSCCIDMVF